MLVRIVKMNFRDEEIATFEKLFITYKELIRQADGCQHLQLLKDAKDRSIFFTYSWWQDEDCLNKYRKSELFGEVWSQTKVLFAEKPEAWSCESLHTLS